MSLPSGPGSEDFHGHSPAGGSPTTAVDADPAGQPLPPLDAPALKIEQALSRRLPSIAWAPTIVPFDGELDHYQRDAVARALTTPDFVQIQGPSGTGKTRVAVEIARQSLALGRRVLWLSGSPAGLSAALGQFARLPNLEFRRVCGPEESLETLPADQREHTAPHREQSLLAGRLAEIRSRFASVEEELRLIESLPTVLRELHETTPILERDQARHDELTRRRDQLEQETEREIAEPGESASYLVQRLRKLDLQYQKENADREAALAELKAAETGHGQARELAVVELEDLRPMTEAVRSGGIFSLAKWKAKLDSSLPGRLASAESRLAEADEKMAGIALERTKLEEAARTQCEEYQGKRARFLAEEIEKRARELNQEITDLSASIASHAASRDERVARVAHAGVPVGWSEAELADRVRELRAKLAELRGTEENLPADCAVATAAWASTTPLTIGPVESVATIESERFDLLILDDAHHLHDTILFAAGRLAGRWTLCGESPERQHRGAPARPEWWGRLWHALHHPRTWVTEGEHLVCRLHPLTAAERRKCDREPVADNPAIELRLASFLAEPVLAEVAFPANFQATAAREFLYRELDELTIQPASHSPAWESSAGRVTCRFAPAEPEASVAVASHPGGVTEDVCDLDTLALHFDESEGWTAESAKEWLDERGLKRSPGRAIALHRSQRACPGLACWLNEAFRIGYHEAPRSGGEPHVEFLAVPDLRGRRDPNPARAGRPGGAGYEIALHEPKQRSLLPDELSRLLPDRGFVNLAEAQAIVQFVENHPSASMRVTSPFPAQVIVLRHLLGKSRSPQVSVMEPGEAGSCECDWLVVSLTRSHVSRAVTFGESPAVLRRLVGCARRKILFAGDPGTLSRRLQWEGPVDHLDASEAAHERNWVAALADCPRVSAHRHRPSPTSA